ncbi:HAMP domain-containing histidine kinase [Staphylococcus hyicus]|uniref:sensor histidine kinase n=1 Tax=Staphylococcus hyicus TaxID=1284 RepID=UPI00217EE9B3|nr:HAMP domain-containing sensor histidine kinase [Staphylococcus hyicus]UWF56983.1 HAMP domain-containing histidine kinase [Staphylococcus hyicus]
MIYILVVVLMCINVFIGSQYLRFRRELQYVEQQLKQLNKAIDSNQVIRSSSHMKSCQSFIRELNRYIHQLNVYRQFFRKKELMLNKEINNVSHDLRTPLTAIKGYSELMQETSNPSEIQAYAKVIDQKAAHLIHSVNLFHELTYMNALDYELELESYVINDFVQEQFMSYFNQFHEKGMVVTFHMPTSYRAFIHHESMIRVLDNVIQNSLRYGNNIVNVSIQELQDDLIVCIQNDTMLDLRTEQLSHLFERSYTLDESRTQQQTGVGLYIVKTLMLRQQGNASIQFNQPMFEMRLTLKRDASCVT